MDVLGSVSVLLGGELHHREGENIHATEGEAVAQEGRGQVGRRVPLQKGGARVGGAHN